MAMRVCIEPSCPALTSKTRCPTHERAKDKARGTRQARGYDADFERAKLEPEYVNATHCTECDEPFTETNPKTAGHSTAIRNGGQGSKILPQCRRCNYGWRRTGL